MSEMGGSEAFTLSGGFFMVESQLLKDGDRFVIAGYASFDAVDRAGDKITLEALKEAFDRMMKVPERRNLMFYHSNIQIGRILPSFKDSSGKTWRSGVDDSGLFIVAEIFDDVEKAREVRAAMRSGKYLSFSVGGQVLKDRVKCRESKCFREILRLDLHEVSSCMSGVNQAAKAFILKGGDSYPFVDVAEIAMNDAIEARPNNNFIKEYVIERDGKNNMSETPNVNTEPQVVKTDLQVVLESIDRLSKLVEDLKPKAEAPAVNVADIVKAVDELITKKLDEFRVMIEDAKKKPKEEKPEYYYYYYYKKPEKKDFKCEEEFNKAESEFLKLKEEIKKELAEEAGQVITKAPMPPKEEKKIDYAELFKKAETVNSISELLNR